MFSDDSNDRKSKVCVQSLKPYNFLFLFEKKQKKQPLFCTHWSGLPRDNERHHITPWIGLHTLLPFDVFIPNCDCRLFSLVTFYLSYCEKSLKTSSKCACAIFFFFFFPSIRMNVSLTFYFYECTGPADRQTVNSCSSWLCHNYSTLQACGSVWWWYRKCLRASSTCRAAAGEPDITAATVD